MLINSVSARQVCKQFTEAGIMADAYMDSGCLLNKKIRNAQLAQYNFILGKDQLFLFSCYYVIVVIVHLKDQTI